MVKIPCYDEAGNARPEIEVDEALFDSQVRWRLLKDAVHMYTANLRQGTHDTKRKGERSGGNTKPWRQKGTGRARCGSSRSPLWRKGGRIHGPKPREYYYRLPKKALQTARNSAIYGKLKDGEVVCVEKFPAAPVKTKTVFGLFSKINLLGGSLLVSTHEADEGLFRMTRNIPKVHLKKLEDVNAYDILRHKRWVVTKGALDKMIEARRGAAKKKAEA